MRPLIRGIVAVAGGLAIINPALAQKTPDQTARAQASETIIVTGKLPSPSEARDVSAKFVQNFAALPVSGQFARWKTPVCPKVIGLQAAHRDIVAGEIARVANGAGITLGGSRCKANLIVTFAEDANGLVGAMKTQHGKLLASIPTQERELLVNSELPVRWWYLTDVQGADGHQMSSDSAALLTAQISGSAPGFISNGKGRYVDGYDSSLIGTRVRVNIEGASVIVDANRAQGRSLKAVASYVAMVTLARIKLGSIVESEDSILGLFAGAGAIVRNDLSAQDRAFLAALYKVPPNRDARQQRGAIIQVMTKILSSPS